MQTMRCTNLNGRISAARPINLISDGVNEAVFDVERHRTDEADGGDCKWSEISE